MLVNVKRKVGEINLQVREFLLPLFEVVVNAIHAIEESHVQDGLIRIIILRDTSQETLSEDFEPGHMMITGFEVKDNGIGFTDKHFQAFNEEYAEFKLDKGGKGVGRFTILAAFAKMSVESTFQLSDHYMTRGFTFDVEKDVDPYQPPIESDKRTSGTTVTLQRYHQQFVERSKVPQEYVAQRIVEHCLIYYLNETMPRCLIFDQQTNVTIALDDVYKNFTQRDGNPIVFECGSDHELFKLDFIKEYRSWGANRIHLCGNNRETVVTKVHDLIPCLENSFTDSHGQYFISVYVTGKYLDDNVIDTRNAFKFPNKISDKEAFWKLSLEEITESARVKIEEKYAGIISAISESTYQKIHDYVYFGGGIEYKHLLKDPKNLRNFSPNVSHEQIDEELHRLDYKVQKQHRKKIEKLVKLKQVHNYEQFHEEFRKVLADDNMLTQSKLANYVIRRKYIIDLFEKLLEWNLRSKKYSFESELHNIIFPMGESNQTVSLNDHNLWLLDEKLTYYQYVSSDEKIKSNPFLESESLKETDLLIFDFPWAYSVDSFSSVIIFEFKRPGRLFTGDGRRIDQQVLDYFEDLSKASAKNFGGRYLNIKRETPKFGYIVCEINSDLLDFLKGFGGGYRVNSDGWLFRYFEGINLHVEILTYDQVLSSARLRHKAFFRKLGIDNVSISLLEEE